MQKSSQFLANQNKRYAITLIIIKWFISLLEITQPYLKIENEHYQEAIWMLYLDAILYFMYILQIIMIIIAGSLSWERNFQIEKWTMLTVWIYMLLGKGS